MKRVLPVPAIPSIAILIAALCAAGCAKKAAPRQAAVPVEVASVVKMSAPLTITSNGVAEPLQTVQVLSQVGGTLQEVKFHEGDDVKAGQVLFRIDPRPFEAALRQAQATLTRDKAQAESARRDAVRYDALVAKDYVTKSQADQQAAMAAAAEATVQADSAALESARVNLGYTTIRAPISGRTGSLLVRQGNLVRANQDNLVVINQIRPILVRFPVMQHDFPALKRRAAEGAVPVFGSVSDSTTGAESGTLSFIDNAVDSLTSTVTAKARFENASSVLWPGEYVHVTVQLSVQPNVLTIPSRALLQGPTGSYVFVLKADHTAVVRPIQAGREMGDLVVVDSGLSAGERVVVDGQSRLTPGARVDVKGEAALAGRPGGDGGAGGGGGGAGGGL